ncbi:NAD(P)H-binding protein [Zhouia amylolytica]|uniref:NAD(P)H-binding protein n=1 Tax=Zhouia amylolytica TaxID=376730 RepID=UPI0020CE9891|nr:NAD(P)H-binding protein [Zhouia amylolytica]MCQ0110883.1 NAD(P)H-binding protein [Zhouia amylolytica]
MNKTAIIIGATGLTGGMLLELLLESDTYETVKVFTRKPLKKQHDKIKEYVMDLLDLESYQDDFKADVVFCCVGTTAAKTPDKEIYRKIDYGIPVAAASLCQKNDIDTFMVISALGANVNSRVFYNRTKGEMEEAVLQCRIPRTFILQPSLIGGEREEKRTGEYLAKQLMKPMNWFMIGPLKKYRSIHPKTIVKTMVWLADNDYEMTRIESDIIQEIAKGI